MTGNEYQALARRTQNGKLTKAKKADHAMFGMVAEVGEIASIFQHAIQDGTGDRGNLSKEIGDLFWFIAELCDVFGFSIDEIMQSNIDKLKKRYPEGFSEERSVNRHSYGED